MKSIAILGRQPALGLAELESLYGTDSLQPFGRQAALLSISPEEIDFSRLGGSIRLARILTELPSADWQAIEDYLLDTAPEHARSIDGKLSFGISVFGLNVPAKRIAKTALSVKKAIRNAGNSVRMVPHDSTELNAATILYNKLTGKNGWELLIVGDSKTAYLAQTVSVQDIDAYAARDQKRPFRDAKVGMLPPKLAQVIINLATADLNPRHGGVVLDPFCGTGVVLQEATLMDFDIYGTDIEPRMIQYSIDNLKWLDNKYPEAGDYRRVEVADATTHQWHNPDTIKAVACETFLGKPLSALPSSEQLSKIIYEANLINHRFLKNIASQLSSGSRLCVAVPVWRGRIEFLHLPALDHLTDMGYTVVKFKHASNADLIYHREGQVVGRELLVLEKK